MRHLFYSFKIIIIYILLIILPFSQACTIGLGAFDNNFSGDNYFLQENEVYLGGFPIGLDINLKGCIVEDFYKVHSSIGEINIHNELEKGDIIIRINNRNVCNVDDIITELDKIIDKTNICLQVIRYDRVINVYATAIKDELSNKYRLGVSVKNRVCGIGTMTYIKSNGRFGGLGHSVLPNDNININGGILYNAQILGFVKGQRGKAGFIQGSFSSESIGNIDKNCQSGIFGNVCVDKSLPRIKIGKKQYVRKGKAFIYSGISGKNEFYEIEILKIGGFNKSQKNIVIKVTDKRLINYTNGILQGMSGTPIIQDNKLIGAVTHVFVNDPTRGYGIFIDYMYDN